MKVGDYVRIKNGIIDKISDIDVGKNYYHIHLYNELDCYAHTKDEIIKSSLNIIELFEEHDLVVIEYYSLRYDERVTRLFEVTYKDNKNIVFESARCSFMLINNDFNDKDKKLEPIIKSIVTREMFESMEYKVGE